VRERLFPSSSSTFDFAKKIFLWAKFYFCVERRKREERERQKEKKRKTKE